MKVAIFGLGYVGFTAACCITHEGHQVVGIDVNESKVRDIGNGLSPIIEPGVDELLKNALAKGLLTATTTSQDQLDDCDIAIVCVGTPSAADGSHNMRYIADVSRQIATSVGSGRMKPLTVAYRSTIRPGTIDDLITPIFRSVLDDDFESAVELVYNPEFLRESSAVADYFNPPKIVIGTADKKPSANMDALHAHIEAPTFCVGFREAELTKFVDNSWHAVKVAFANEIGRVCMELGISATQVHEIFVSDTKLNISAHYMRPGGPFGGSCLPKDVRALQSIAADCGANTHLVDSLIRSNEAHKHQLFERARRGLPEGGSVLIAGLAFKPDTDDLRESPHVDLARKLIQSGYRVSVFDPAIDAAKLVGANLGYAYAQIPSLQTLLVDKEQAEAGTYDRIVATNRTVDKLDLPANADVVTLEAIP